MSRLLLVTGFGLFEDVEDNPSGEVALRLAGAPLQGVETIAGLLPVSFSRAPKALDDLLTRLRPRVPDLLVGLGVMRERGYRIELCARSRLRGRVRVDVDGGAAFQAEPSPYPDLRSPLEPWLRGWTAQEDGFRISENAGGYVCERVYHCLLVHSRALGRPCVFLHVPPTRFTPVEEQMPVVRRFLTALANECVNRSLPLPLHGESDLRPPFDR